ncbi:MAG TPA: molybdopterin-binding protein [Microvirga sp.]|nr:molybdopterin-binding protein [Microvirga sp.]
MKFGPLAVEEAAGAIAAHSVRAGEAVVKKGSVIAREDVQRLKAAGIDRVVAARLEPGDIGEDEAAGRLAEALAGQNVSAERPFTGRSNLFARTAGVLLVDRAAVDSVNTVDEAITAATLPAYKPVVVGEMIGTVKIIPYAVREDLLEEALGRARQGLSIAPYARRRVGVISTLLPGLKTRVIDKTVAVLRGRLEPAGAAVCTEARVPHETEPLSRALAEQAAGEPELIVVYGASAIADRRDVVPAAIEAAGGRVEHFGMPVDPGNLLLVGALDGTPVIGAPGCARSPKENGFDWVLQRLLAGLSVTRADITALGVGGLLMEIVSRPQPRGGGESRDEP